MSKQISKKPVVIAMGAALAGSCRGARPGGGAGGVREAVARAAEGGGPHFIHMRISVLSPD